MDINKNCSNTLTVLHNARVEIAKALAHVESTQTDAKKFHVVPVDAFAPDADAVLRHAADFLKQWGCSILPQTYDIVNELVDYVKTHGVTKVIPKQLDGSTALAEAKAKPGLKIRSVSRPTRLYWYDNGKLPVKYGNDTPMQNDCFDVNSMYTLEG